MSQFAPPDRPYQYLSNDNLAIQLDVCTQTIGVIETSLDELAQLVEECEGRGDTQGVAYAQEIFDNVKVIFDQTLDDYRVLGEESRIRKQPRNN